MYRRAYPHQVAPIGRLVLPRLDRSGRDFCLFFDLLECKAFDGGDGLHVFVGFFHAVLRLKRIVFKPLHELFFIHRYIQTVYNVADDVELDLTGQLLISQALNPVSDHNLVVGVRISIFKKFLQVFDVFTSYELSDTLLNTAATG